MYDFVLELFYVYASCSVQHSCLYSLLLFLFFFVQISDDDSDGDDGDGDLATD